VVRISQYGTCQFLSASVGHCTPEHAQTGSPTTSDLDDHLAAAFRFLHKVLASPASPTLALDRGHLEADLEALRRLVLVVALDSEQVVERKVINTATINGLAA